MPDSFQQSIDASQSSETRLILQRLETIQRDIDTIKTDNRRTLDDHEARLRSLERQQTILESRVNVFGVLQGLYSTVVAAAAAFFGVRQ